ncbi:CBO0543 family protein [Thalassobacillus pellis]|uniref:CBO0543 family protein n=1 Tax=Thalassobacillus pellis TaxID=748008 RepID=UPI003B82E482
MCRRVPVLFLTVAPFISFISITCNQIGMEMGFWTLYPQTYLLILNSINIDLGFNPASGLIFTYMIYFRKWRRWIVYLGFILFLNGAEMTALFFDKVTYNHGWNMSYTFITYVIGLIIFDFYFTLLKKLIHRFPYNYNHYLEIESSTNLYLKTQFRYDRPKSC